MPKTRRGKLEKLIKQTVTEVITTGVLVGMQAAKNEVKNVFKQTELRLYAYPELKKNIDKYLADIEDLECESPGRSKDIVFYRTGSSRLTADEIQEARIMVIKGKINRDQNEINEIDFALEAIGKDEYYQVIAMKYFEGKNDDEIAEIISCDPSTVRRNKSRLIRRIAVKLYGAQAVS